MPEVLKNAWDWWSIHGEKIISLKTLLGSMFLIVLTLTGILRRFYYRIISFIIKRYSVKSTIPKTTLLFVYKPTLSWWHMGNSSDGPCMQVVTRWYATNVIDGEVLITGAYTNRPKVYGGVSTRNPLDDFQEIYGEYYIPGGVTTDVTIDFFIRPPIRKEGKNLKLNIVVKDQLNNEHRLNNVVVKYR